LFFDFVIELTLFGKDVKTINLKDLILITPIKRSDWGTE